MANMAEKTFLEIFGRREDLHLAKVINLIHIPYKVKVAIGNILDVPDCCTGQDYNGLGESLGIDPNLLKVLAHRHRESGVTIEILDAASKKQKTFFDVFCYLSYPSKDSYGTKLLIKAWPDVKKNYFVHGGLRPYLREGQQNSWNCPETNQFSQSYDETSVKFGCGAACDGSDRLRCDGSCYSSRGICDKKQKAPIFDTRQGNRHGNRQVHDTRCSSHGDGHDQHGRRCIKEPCCDRHYHDPPNTSYLMSVNNLSANRFNTVDEKSVVSNSDNCSVPLLPKITGIRKEMIPPPSVSQYPPTNSQGATYYSSQNQFVNNSTNSEQTGSDSESGISVLDNPKFHSKLPKPSSRPVICGDVVMNYIDERRPEGVSNNVGRSSLGVSNNVGRSSNIGGRSPIGDRMTGAVNFIPNICHCESEIGVELVNDRAVDTGRVSKGRLADAERMADGRLAEAERMADGRLAGAVRMVNIPLTVEEFLNEDVSDDVSSLSESIVGSNNCNGYYNTPVSPTDVVDNASMVTESDIGPSASQVNISQINIGDENIQRPGILPEVTGPESDIELSDSNVQRTEQREEHTPLCRTEEAKFIFVIYPATNQRDNAVDELMRYFVRSNIPFMIDAPEEFIYSRGLLSEQDHQQIINQDSRFYKKWFEKAHLVLMLNVNQVQEYLKHKTNVAMEDRHRKRLEKVIKWTRQEVKKSKEPSQRFITINSAVIDRTRNLTKIKSRFQQNEILAH